MNPARRRLPLVSWRMISEPFPIFQSTRELPCKSLEQYFEPFRRQIVGQNQEFETPYGR